MLAVIAVGIAAESRASVLYSTILGATTAGSSQPAYVSSLNLTGDVNNGGSFGFGDDYTTGFSGVSGATISGNPYIIPTDNYVQITSLSFYGDLEPGPNGSMDRVSKWGYNVFARRVVEYYVLRQIWRSRHRGDDSGSDRDHACRQRGLIRRPRYRAPACTRSLLRHRFTYRPPGT